jgi:hypothetical protein
MASRQALVLVNPGPLNARFCVQRSTPEKMTYMSEDTQTLNYEEFVKLCQEAGIDSDNKAEMEFDFRVGGALADLVTEIEAASSKFPAMNSAHEGFAVLKEEVDELWDIVKKKQGERDIDHMRKEAIQVAAMAIRFVADICVNEKAQN